MYETRLKLYFWWLLQTKTILLIFGISFLVWKRDRKRWIDAKCFRIGFFHYTLHGIKLTAKYVRIISDLFFLCLKREWFSVVVVVDLMHKFRNNSLSKVKANEKIGAWHDHYISGNVNQSRMNSHLTSNTIFPYAYRNTATLNLTQNSIKLIIFSFLAWRYRRNAIWIAKFFYWNIVTF